MYDPDVLSEMDMMMSNDQLRGEVQKQITVAEPVHTFTKNFLNVFYMLLKYRDDNRESEDNEVDSDAIAKNRADMDWFYTDVINSMYNNCGIILDTAGQVFDPEVINSIYSTFVFGIHRNMIEFLVSTILYHKEHFAGFFANQLQGNVSLKNARKTFKNKVDAIIAIKYSDIIDLIFQTDEYITPETIVYCLYNANKEDIEYTSIFNLYEVIYLQFDVPKFIKYLRRAYSNTLSYEALKISVQQRMIPCFPQKNPNDNDEGE